MKKLTILLIIAAAALTMSLPAYAQAEKVTICHAAGLDDTDKFVEITASWNAIYGQAGHFNEDGTPRAGHEDDYVGSCESTTTTLPPTTVEETTSTTTTVYLASTTTLPTTTVTEPPTTTTTESDTTPAWELGCGTIRVLEGEIFLVTEGPQGSQVEIRADGVTHTFDAVTEQGWAVYTVDDTELLDSGIFDCRPPAVDRPTTLPFTGAADNISLGILALLLIAVGYRLVRAKN